MDYFGFNSWSRVFDASFKKQNKIRHWCFLRPLCKWGKRRRSFLLYEAANIKYWSQGHIELKLLVSAASAHKEPYQHMKVYFHYSLILIYGPSSNNISFFSQIWIPGFHKSFIAHTCVIHFSDILGIRLWTYDSMM